MIRSIDFPQLVAPRNGTRRALATLFTVVLFLSFSLAPPLHAQHKIIDPGTPTADGVDTFTIKLDNGTIVSVRVDITKDPGTFNNTRDKKIHDIVDAINDTKTPGLSASATQQGISLGGGTVKQGALVTTGEKDSFAALGPVGPGSFATVAFAGKPTGIAFDGTTATYQAELGFGNVSVSSTVTFGTFSPASLDGLMKTTYNNLLTSLPSSDRSNLSLDLSTDTIRFNYPNGATNPFVAVSTSDHGLSAMETLATPVPEPFSLALVSIGGVSCAGWFWLVRKKKTADISPNS